MITSGALLPPPPTPPRNPLRDTPSPRTVRIMALNPEPADPVERAEQDLPEKSYADAVLDDPEQNGDHTINEDAIKETPPRNQHARQNSEPRPLGEVIDEADHSPGSPTLRHPKGRLEEKDSRESYAEAVRKSSFDGSNGHAIANGGVNGARTPETFAGVGEDETPRSPIRRAHKRTSSKSLNGNIDKNDASKLQPNGNKEPGELVYENVYNKSGDNLASIQPSSDYYAALKQREDKPPASQPPPRQLASHERTNSELVSGRRAGAGWSRSAIRWAPLNVPLQRRLQTLLVLLHTLSIAGGLALFCFLCTLPLLWPILVPYLLYVLLSRAAVDGKLSHRSERLRGTKIWSLFGSYFPARLHRSQELEPTRKYIFGYHPHGIISHGAFAAFATEALGFSQLFPGITNTLLTLDSNFRIPLYRDYALRMGLASVSRESCENILSRGGPNGEGMGRAITIVIGGARESLDAKPYTMRLVLKRRKGFVKLAIQTGADLVPVLAFGENEIYEQLDTKAHPYVHRMQMLVKKFMGFTVPLFHARGVSSLRLLALNTY